MRRAFVVALAASLLLVAGAATAKKRRRSKRPSYTGPNPCERITPEVIGKALGVTVGKPDVRQGRYAKESCAVSWDKPNAAAIEQRMQQEMMASMKARMQAASEGKKPPPIKTYRTTNEVILTFSRELLPSKADAGARLEGAIKGLDRGYTASAEVEVRGKEVKKTVTYQASSAPVAGVGDRAWWTGRMQQLAVHDGTGHFYVSVRLDDDDRADVNKAYAITIAKALLSTRAAGREGGWPMTGHRPPGLRSFLFPFSFSRFPRPSPYAAPPRAARR